MVWSNLDINKPHLVYIILGGFTSIFMLCSSIIKERLYIGEATVATIVGVIFGPYAANLIDPRSWGNVDQITLEFARIVLVVQCFAVGVELPKMYMNRHWKSVSLLLVPVMGFGWMMTTLFIWWMFYEKLSFIGALCCAACVTATDPVLASSVVGKGKFARERVPKHLRDLLSAESGCNDGMAFPFIYLALYLIQFHSEARQVTFHWICYTILYECVFGAVYGFLVGYLARRAIRFSHERDLIDRESFLVFYFVLALFCAGSGSMLGMDDLLIGFACGVGFSNDGWFQEKTEESHVSNVIDLLINLAFFVYFGTIIPWKDFNNADYGTVPWKLVVVGVLVILFRRIPIMLLFKPIIKDLKTWREALFAGHFGPIGVGALFVAILARAELETETTTPLPLDDVEKVKENLAIINLLWPITTFLVICSIIVHGSSVAVFTLGRHINTLSLSFSFTTAVEDGPNWMDRLPRITSRSKSSVSLQRGDNDAETLDEKTGRGPLSPRNVPKNFLRRQKEEDNPSRSSSRAGRRRKKWDSGIGPGGPISQSAIMPTSRLQSQLAKQSGDLADQTPSSGSEVVSPRSGSPAGEPQEEIYREGSNIVIEDEEGTVLGVRSVQDRSDAEVEKIAEDEALKLIREKDVQHGVSQTESPDNKPNGSELQRPGGLERRGSAAWWKSRMESLSSARRQSESDPSTSKAPVRRGPARAYTLGNTVIVEDEDGEVIKQYQLPSNRRPVVTKSAAQPVSSKPRDVLQRMGQYLGAGSGPSSAAKQSSLVDDLENNRPPIEEAETEDDKIRFMLAEGGPRLRKDEFINELKKMDTRSRARVVEQISATERDLQQVEGSRKRASISTPAIGDLPQQRRPSMGVNQDDAQSRSSSEIQHVKTTETIPGHAVSDSLAHLAFERGGRETAAQRRRRRLEGSNISESRGVTVPDSDSDTSPPPVVRRSSVIRRRSSNASGPSTGAFDYIEQEETAAERRRRQAALGLTKEEESSSSEGEDATGFRELRPMSSSRVDDPTRSSPVSSRHTVGSSNRRSEQDKPDTNPRSSGMRLRWGEDVGRKP
jgi:NhaP-type Na+/H+ or K+/H+ antiporter